MSMLIAMDGLDTAGCMVLLLVLVVAGWIAVVVTLRRWLRAELEELSMRLYEHTQEAQERLENMATAQKHTVTVDAPAPVVAVKAAEPLAVAPTAKVEADAVAAAPVTDEISPEILAVISAAVAHFCGANARIRQAQAVQGFSSWAQQGRCYIQASHNLAAQRAHA